MDLLITEYGNSFGIDQVIHDTYFSDHSALIIETKISRIPMTECTTKSRSGKRFQHWNWVRDLTKVNEVLEDLIPKKIAKVKTHRSQPWFSKILKTSKKLV